MEEISRDLRERIINHYASEATATYDSTADHFGVGRASVNRILRIKRETGELFREKGEKARRFKVDLAWLSADLEADPNGRLKDRIARYVAHAGERVSIPTMWLTVQHVGYTHKKKRSLPVRSEASV